VGVAVVITAEVMVAATAATAATGMAALAMAECLQVVFRPHLLLRRPWCAQRAALSTCRARGFASNAVGR
jgi:hypothetical protein